MIASTNGFPGDSILSYNIEEQDASKAVLVLERAGFWNVRACRLEPAEGRWKVQVSAMLDVTQNPNPMQLAVDALNVACIPFWPAGSEQA